MKNVLSTGLIQNVLFFLSRDFSPLINSLQAPIIVRRGPRGFGFTIRAIRVYFGDTDIYTVHHLVMEVGPLFRIFDMELKLSKTLCLV